MTETHLLSLDGDKAGDRLPLRQAYLTGCTVRSELIEHSRLVRVVDYAETYRDGCYEIAVAITKANG